jgi:putative transposase
MIEPEHKMITIARQCELLNLPRSSCYYVSGKNDRYNQLLMNLIDAQYTKMPFCGVAKMTAWLRRQGHFVNQKRVRRLMRLMGLEAIYPKPNLSKASPAHKKYPYLLKNIVIDQPDQVWAADITYIRMQQGFIYLVVIMDWFSRYVLSWEISITLEAGFCVDALKRALEFSHPVIMNTDQGVQFTGAAFIGTLESRNIRISMDGRGRAFDNIFVERLWRSVKYEEVYLHQYTTVSDARRHLERYFRLYNTERLHESLGYRTPYEVYFKEQPGCFEPKVALVY